jgi:hypothetical protein
MDNNYTAKDLIDIEGDEIWTHDHKRMMIRTINEMREDMHKHLNEAKENINKQLNK